MSFQSSPTIYLFACSSASHFLVVCAPLSVVLSPATLNNKCVLHCCFINTFFTPPPSHPTPFNSTPCYSTLPLGSTPVTHLPCHTPNPFHSLPLLLPPPSTIIHAPIWCRGRSPSTGPRAPCSLNGADSVSCSAYATTRSGLSSTPPLGGCCGPD